MSQKFARRQFVVSSVMTGAVLAVVFATQLMSSGGSKVSLALAMVVVIAIAGFMYWRNYQQATSFASGHSLLLSTDAILIRDGPTERKIPYESIELLRVRRPILGEANFSLKVRGIPTDTFYGYENIEELVSALAARLPSDRVKGRLVHA